MKTVLALLLGLCCSWLSVEISGPRYNSTGSLRGASNNDECDTHELSDYPCEDTNADCSASIVGTVWNSFDPKDRKAKATDTESCRSEDPDCKKAYDMDILSDCDPPSNG